MSAQLQLVALLEASLLRPVFLVAAAWLVLRALRVRHPASRHAVWTAVLVGMLLLPFIRVITPDLTVPVLPPAEFFEEPTIVPSGGAIAEDAVDVPHSLPEIAIPSASVPETAFAWPPLETLMIWAYLAGLVAMLAYRFMGWLLLKRVLARSTSMRPGCLRESADVLAPVAVGVLRPSVILPAGWRTWSAVTKRAVLAHEFAHLRRGDTLVAALARCVKCVLWFHPAAWWVARQTSDLAELSCDAVALQRVGDPAGYSRVLVEFASAVNQARSRVALPGLAIASRSRMDDRVDQVFEMSKGTMRKLARPRVWLLAAGVPALCLAATVVPGAQQPRLTRGQVAVAAVGQTFDVVSIKPCGGLPTPGTGRGPNPRVPQLSPGHAVWGCVTLEELADLAYSGPDSPLLNTRARPRSRMVEWPDDPTRVRGGPAWVYSERFAIEARAAGVVAPETLTGPMLRTLLSDRFQLKTHRVAEERPMYALSVAAGGLKINPIARDECWSGGRGATRPPEFENKPSCGTMRGSPTAAGTMRYEYIGAELGRFLGDVMDRFVIDNTKVDGRYSFTLEFVPDARTPWPVNRPGVATGSPAPRQGVGGATIFKALESLGLTLEPTRGPAEYLVIDSAQRPKPDAPQAVGPATQQQTAAPGSKFEAASIKPCAPVAGSTTGRGTPPYSPNLSPGYIRWDCISLYELIHQAYATGDIALLNNRIVGPSQGDPWLIQGGPEWVMKDRFTIEIRISGETDRPDLRGTALFGFRQQEMAPALRALIEERFQLRLRRVTGQRPVYALTVAQGGVTLQPATPGDCWDYAPNADGTIPKSGSGRGGVTPGQKPADAGDKPHCGAGFGGLAEIFQIVRTPPSGVWNFQGGNITMQDFARFLSRQMDRAVVDKTGLATRFTFRMSYIVDDSTPGTEPGMSRARPVGVPRGVGVPRTTPASTMTSPPPADGLTIFQALAKLGLELIKTNGPAEHFVIDGVQRPRPNLPAGPESTR